MREVLTLAVGEVATPLPVRLAVADGPSGEDIALVAEVAHPGRELETQTLAVPVGNIAGVSTADGCNDSVSVSRVASGGRTNAA